MKSTNLRRMCERGLPLGQPINVIRVPAHRRIIGQPSLVVLLTAGQWFARFRERRRVQQRKLRQLRRAHRSGRAIKRR